MDGEVQVKVGIGLRCPDFSRRGNGYTFKAKLQLSSVMNIYRMQLTPPSFIQLGELSSGCGTSSTDCRANLEGVHKDA